MWKAVKTHIAVQPEPYLGLLGLEPATFRLPKKMRTMTQIMISKGKGAGQSGEAVTAQLLRCKKRKLQRKAYTGKGCI